MTDTTIPRAALVAAARAFRGDAVLLGGGSRDPRYLASVALTAAYPLLRKEIADQIAAVIEARQSPYGPGDADDRYRFGVRDSAALARSFGGGNQ